MKKPTLRERFRYWFDGLMSQGTASMIRLLLAVTLLFSVLLATILFALGGNEGKSLLLTIWDCLVTTGNAWLPMSNAGDRTYLIFMSTAALVGLFFTSMLISILTSGMQENLTKLRRGSSRVLEEGHTVVLGFRTGSYELVRELCMAQPGVKRCIVVAGEMEKEKMEDLLRENIDLPKWIKLICRRVDVCDEVSLGCCAIPESKCVILQGEDDTQTIKMLLAVTSLLEDCPRKVTIAALIQDTENLAPVRAMGNKGIIALPMGDVVARLVAHSCTQAGIAMTFRELFSFQGSELYYADFPELVGKTFAQLSMLIDEATPVGLMRGGETILAPEGYCLLEEGDRVLVLMRGRNDVKVRTEPVTVRELPQQVRKEERKRKDRILVLGYSGAISLIARELEERDNTVVLAGLPEEKEQEYSEVQGFIVSPLDIREQEYLENLAAKADHVVMLSDRAQEDDAADFSTLMLLLRLQELRDRLGLHFNVTAEMRLEQNKRLVRHTGYADFIVGGEIASMMMAQVAETPALYEVFKELLSNRGKELFLVPAEAFVTPGVAVSSAELRLAALARGAAYLGYAKSLSSEHYSVWLNPGLTEKVTFQSDDGIIVLADSGSVY